MRIVRSAEEVERQRNMAADAIMAGGSKWPGMSYEEGVENTILWLRGESDDSPMEDA